MDRIKFLVFADIHHYPGVFCTDAPKRFAAIRERAEREKVDFMVSLGDYCHSPTTFTDFVEESFKSSVPLYHVMGNHDTDGATVEDTLRLYRMPKEYYWFERGPFRFIAIDTNYYASSAGFTHYQYRNYFDFPKTRETLPPEELEFIENAIMESKLPCVLLSHASLDRVCGGEIRNRDALWAIINRANSDRRRVLMSLNGHHHRDGLTIIDNVACFDVNSASFDWLSHPHDFFPEELTGQYELADHQIIFSEPLSAIVTLSTDGTIEIDGMKGSFMYGVSREMTDNGRVDGAGRPCTGNILSAKLRLM